MTISTQLGIILNIRIMLQEQIASTGLKQLYYALCTIYRITQVLNKFVSKLIPYSTMILAIFVTTWFGLFSSKSFYTNPNRVWPLIKMIDLWRVNIRNTLVSIVDMVTRAVFCKPLLRDLMDPLRTHKANTNIKSAEP